MPRKIALTDKQLLNELQNLYGVELTAADVKGFCASRSINYQTVTPVSYTHLTLPTILLV